MSRQVSKDNQLGIKFKQARNYYVKWCNEAEDGARAGDACRQGTQEAYEKVICESKSGRRFERPKQLFVEVSAYFEVYGRTPAEDGMETSFEDRFVVSVPW